jgi:hypothetical protein
MGTRIVFKKNGITYIASDVSPQINEKNLNDYNTYMTQIQDGVILAKRDHDLVLDLLSIHPQWFLVEKDEEINKKFVVNKIVKPLIDEAIKRKYLDQNKVMMTGTAYIITQNKMFQITSSFIVIEAEEFLSADIEEFYAFYHYIKQSDVLDLEIFLRELFSKLHKKLIYVDKNFVLMDNQSYQYKFIRG